MGVGPPGCLAPALALNLRDRRLRVGEGLDPRVEKAEVLDGSRGVVQFLDGSLPTPPAASRATACAPIRCPLRC
jgi:hypothetical protein